MAALSNYVNDKNRGPKTLTSLSKTEANNVKLAMADIKATTGDPLKLQCVVDIGGVNPTGTKASRRA